jgi:hypothetical protein
MAIAGEYPSRAGDSLKSDALAAMTRSTVSARPRSRCHPALSSEVQPTPSGNQPRGFGGRGAAARSEGGGEKKAGALRD